MLKVSLLIRAVLKVQGNQKNKAPVTSGHTAVWFSSSRHQIIRLIFLCACSGDNFKQAFPNEGQVAEASWWKADGFPVWPVQLFTFLFILQKFPQFYSLVRGLASCGRKLLTLFPAPQLSCVIQVKSGYWDRSGFLGDPGGLVIFEIAKKDKNLIVTVQCFPQGRSAFDSSAEAEDMPPWLARVDLWPAGWATPSRRSQNLTPSLASLSYASSR